MCFSYRLPVALNSTESCFRLSISLLRFSCIFLEVCAHYVTALEIIDFLERRVLQQQRCDHCQSNERSFRRLTKTSQKGSRYNAFVLAFSVLCWTCVTSHERSGRLRRTGNRAGSTSSVHCVVKGNLRICVGKLAVRISVQVLVVQGL